MMAVKDLIIESLSLFNEENTLKRLKSCTRLGMELRIKILRSQSNVIFNIGLAIVILNRP